MNASQASHLVYSSPFRPSGSNSSYPPPPPPIHTVVSGTLHGVNANSINHSRETPQPSPTRNRQFLTNQSPTNSAQILTSQLRGPGSVGSTPSSTYTQSPLSQLTSPMALRAPSVGPVVEYNPQQWGAAGPTGGAYIPHSALASTVPRNPEDDPNPPPPYSPPHDRTTAGTPEASGSRPAMPYLQTTLPQRSPDFAAPISAIHRVSPQNGFERNHLNLRTVMASPMNPTAGPPPSFPPPPARDRSASRPRFGLSALTRGISMDRSGVNATPEQQTSPPVRNFNGGVDRTHAFIQAPRPNVAANRMSVFAHPTEPMYLPPSSRRSASAGAGGSQTPIGTTPPPINLPPPPPGPPPGGSRASSRVRDEHIEASSLTVPIISMPTRRPRGSAPTLETVPATPAGWTEDGQPVQMTHPTSIPDDDSIVPSPKGERISRRERPDQEFRLERRDTTVKGIRERRSESRATKDRLQDSSSDDSKPADLTLNLANSGISRQGAVKKGRASMSPQDGPSAGPSSSRRGTLTSMSAPNSAKEKGPAKRDSYDPPNTPNPFARHASRPPSFTGSIQQDSFAKGSSERHQQFIEKERLANSDRERLELFAEYIVMESRLRRDRYAAAFSAISASEILDLTRDLWRPNQPQSTIGKVPARNSSVGPRPLSTRTGSYDSQESGSSPMSPMANFTPRTEDSPSSAGIPPARENMFKNFQPVLSPIPSMAMSTVTGDDAPRGRSQSRWWESDDGGSIGAGGRRIERTARESKYMGLHPDARYNLQYDDQPSPAMASTPGRAGPSNEYPPEKVGWHEDDNHDALSTPHYSVPSTPSATNGLDVSRLVTLPPPYPRHYPATDMSHPELASIRSTIRTLNEMDEISEKKAAFTARITRQRAVSSQEAAARTAQMRHNVSEQVRLGQMSFATAAAAEDEFHAREAAMKQASLRKEYELFSPEVSTPLNALLSERVTKASACIASLREGLDSANGNPDAPMEEGDEHPELLEKLKLIKWLAEVRETSHRELFLLESERCERYRDFILADIEGQQSEGGPAAAKQRAEEARQFFRKDQMQRSITFEKESRTRAEELLATVETHVSQGAQDQLSAFWDIVPGLVELLKKVPVDENSLARFKVSIPHTEIQENPSYSDHPLQYLYGLLCHAEKATYQFIENQVGLWCLLQEVSLVVIRANLRVMKAERCAAEDRDENDAELETEMAQLATFEEQRLTTQLKDRVDTVEGQWNEGLGQVLEACVESVERTLRDTGGWEDGLKD